MEINYCPQIDWEPLIITIWIQNNDSIDITLKKYLDSWFELRQTTPLCEIGCRRKLLTVRRIADNRVRVSLQWACDTCLRKLLHVLEQEYPEITKIQVGYSEAFKPNPLNEKFLRIGARQITLETGATYQVEEFTISKYPISISEYDKFALATGYITCAERRSSKNTFRNNHFIRHLPLPDKMQLEAKFLSYIDVQEYCKWSRVRIPTEPELLAAILIDDREHDEQNTDMKNLINGDQILKHQGLTVTSTREDGCVVARSGPWIIKTKEWKQNIHTNRYILKEDNPVCQFYTIPK